jgi:predicted enzyme related to lactoylglutathione lyase
VIAMHIDVVLIGVAVADLDPALTWYERLFGRPPDLVPNATEAAWQLTAGGWIYVVCDPGRAGHGIVTLVVEDLDDVWRRIRERGVSPEPIQGLGTAGRKALIADPAGNTIALAEPASG